MKSSMLKNITVFAVIVLSAGFTGMASAHEINGELTNAATLSKSAMHVDVYVTYCSSWLTDQPDPDDGSSGPAGRFVYSIDKTGGGADTVKVTGAKFDPTLIGGPSQSDSSNALKAYPASPFVGIVSGNGCYQLVVSHSGSVTSNYTLYAHCERNTAALFGYGIHTKTGIVPNWAAPANNVPPTA
ncbi:MAG: hypothetical protein ABL933_11440, partial [Methyloglobulus sp.]